MGKLVSNDLRLTRRQFFARLVAGGTALIAAAYPTMIERYLVEVNHYNIAVPNLPSTLDGFTIVQLTDIHYGPLMPISLVEQVVERVNQLEKDIVVCTGDYVHELKGTSEIDTVWPVLSRLKAPLGVYNVLGNHDHWASTKHSLYWLERSGQNLHHRIVRIEKNGAHFWLGGTGDLWTDDIDIDPLFANVPPQECKIVLAHNPDTADQRFTTPVDLMISGHTHGGQVVLPFFGALVLPVENKRYVSGLIPAVRGMRIYISRGIGWASLPVRFNCPPEISVLRLVHAPSSRTG
jgi:uncharacterized protein